jgi:hypothetical protein
MKPLKTVAARMNPPSPSVLQKRPEREEDDEVELVEAEDAQEEEEALEEEDDSDAYEPPPSTTQKAPKPPSHFSSSSSPSSAASLPAKGQPQPAAAKAPPAKRVKRTPAELAAEALAKRLSAMPAKQMAEAVASFFTSAAGEPLRGAFVASLPAADVGSLVEQLRAARRAVDKCQPRYSSTNDFAYHRCSGAIASFKRLVTALAKQVADGGVAADTLAFVEGAEHVVRYDMPNFSSSYVGDSYKTDMFRVLGRAADRVAKARGTQGAEERRRLAAIAAELAPPKPKKAADEDD